MTMPPSTAACCASGGAKIRPPEAASGPLGSYLVHHGVVSPEEAGRILSRQGVQMGRPSRIHVQIGMNGDQITNVRIGGGSIFVGEGTLILPEG